MFLRHSGQIFLLWTLFLRQDVLGFCERPAWARVAWEMTPQDLEMVAKEQSTLFHNSVCRIYQCFTGIGLTKGCLEVLEGSCKVALVVALVLAAHFLFVKRKLAKSARARPSEPQLREEEDASYFPVSSNQTTAMSVVAAVNGDSSQDVNKMLYKLVSNTSKMMKYMKRVTYHHRKETKYRRLSKKRKNYEYDDDDQLSPVCLHNHSSSADTI